MPIALRTILLGLAATLVVAGATGLARGHTALGTALIGAGGLLLLFTLRPRPRPDARLVESDDIRDLSHERQAELIRGTSLFLRDVRYPYSVRLDTRDAPRHFSAEVGDVRLGFIPVVMIDNSDDRQGFGFVAFVHDGRRWRGPGLPCPDDQTAAVRHAARCVSPLRAEEE